MRNIWELLRFAPKLSRRDIVLTALPALLWWGAVASRPHLIQTVCVSAPERCAPETINFVDRQAVIFESPQADELSYYTQNLSGILALTVPGVWAGASWIFKTITPTGALLWVGTDLVIAFQTVTWNGAIGEAVRLITQRPRPFVYANPAAKGDNPAHYISFYSGHTSFAAAATVALFFILVSRGAPPIVLGMAGLTAFALTILTGVFRVLAGRHFITDVLVASLAGSLVAFLIAYFHRTRSRRPI